MFQTIQFKAPLIIFGMDTLNQIGKQAKNLGAGRVLIVVDPGFAKTEGLERVASSLGGESLSFEIFDKIEPEPSTDVVKGAYDVAKKGNFDVFIGVGGGSTMDVTKMVSALMTNTGSPHDFFGVGKVKTRGKPTVMIPTTSGTGAEVTKHAIFLDTKDNVKKAVASDNILPNVAIVDPMLVVSCPPHVTASTGLDAFIHAAEPFLSKMANPMTDAIAIQAIRIITRWLGPAVADGGNLEARYYMSLGSLMAGLVLHNSGTSLVHAIAYPIGGEYHTPHGVTLSAILASCFECIVMAKQDRFVLLAEAMGQPVDGLSSREAADQAIEAIRYLIRSVDLPGSLTDLGAVREDSRIRRWAEDAHKEQRLLGRCARKLTVEDIVKILERAF
jgi:alcohol dehydrogenase class IV